MLIKSTLIFVLMLFTQLANAGECDGLVAEMQAMKKAQMQIMNSLANNHESFAVTIEELTAPLKEKKSTVSMKAIMSIDESAQAFRVRGQQAKKISNKFEEATEDLINRVSACLKK